MNVVRAETSGSSDRTVDQFDVVVIGGGPAGTTAATLLSDRGWDVTILDKDIHPRFHIGESLLPCNLPLFDELGVSAQLEQIGVVKPGIDFTLPDGGVRSPSSLPKPWAPCRSRPSRCDAPNSTTC